MNKGTVLFIEYERSLLAYELKRMAASKNFVKENKEF